MTPTHRIGDWTFDGVSLRHADGTERRLEDRAARTLAALCVRRGEVVSRDALLAEVWRGRAVSANSVAVVIGDLRRALDEDAGEPVHLVTVARRGYRLNLESPVTGGGAVQSHWGRWVVAGSAVALVALASWGLAPRSTPWPTVAVAPVRNEMGEAGYDALSRALDTVVTNRLAQVTAVAVTASDTPPADGLTLTPRLILWNGKPELSLTATDAVTGRVVWAAFAAGPAGDLAKATAARLDGLDARLRPGGWLRRVFMRL
ncbi:winged helix-turn-helix domain-containing protein [Nitrospirillum sp. BR 11163]|uniref:winged helix-turn-helix domain-containing protein n=1 Tax=Nitrospirillum sp. BR 11163 TaxID=3104323 RepID=UPI002AFFFCFD|nr:winged helix-turn-helix domain-containing protein [Nitrospirillum sp. BR 11163]MEA1672202.1 winged helix-turn-helix domain-containing protein [Nitrospirillum sp. BR 11163]